MAIVEDILGSLFSFGDALVILLWLLVISIILVVFVSLSKFKHRLTVYERVGNRKLVFNYKAREFIDKDGIVWWQLNRKLKKIKAPPSEAVEIDNKGRKCAMAERREQDSYVYLSVETDDKVTKIRSLNSDDRMAVLYQLRKADEHSKQTFKDVILQFGPVFMLGIVIIVGMVMANDIAQPFFKNKELQNKAMEIQNEQLEILRDIQNNVQTIKPEQGAPSGA